MPANNRPKVMDSSLTVKVPTPLKVEATEKSRETGISLSFVIRKALEDFVKGKHK